MRFSASVPPCHVVPLLLLVLPAVALAQPGGLEPELVTRQLELSQTPRPELWVAPAQATVVVLVDARLDTEATRRASTVKGLRRVEVAEDKVVLVPAAGLKEGDSLELPLWFAEGPPAGTSQPVTPQHPLSSANAPPTMVSAHGATDGGTPSTVIDGGTTQKMRDAGTGP